MHYKKKIIIIAAILSTYSFSQVNSEAKILSLQNSIKQVNSVKTNKHISASDEIISKKSAGIGMLLSMLLPGMGELYADSYSSGKYFTIAEGALWGTYISMSAYGNLLKNNYKSFAASAAGVNNTNKNSGYYSTIADYMNINEYNDDMSLQQNFNLMLNPSTYYWNWKTIADRKNYRTLWTSSEQVNNNLRFVVGALILNRIVSAINAVRLVSAYNKRQDTNLGWNLSFGVSNSYSLPSSLQFNFQTEF
jgi:hypothetical protein